MMSIFRFGFPRAVARVLVCSMVLAVFPPQPHSMESYPGEPPPRESGLSLEERVRRQVFWATAQCLLDVTFGPDVWGDLLDQAHEQQAYWSRRDWAGKTADDDLLMAVYFAVADAEILKAATHLCRTIERRRSDPSTPAEVRTVMRNIVGIFLSEEFAGVSPNEMAFDASDSGEPFRIPGDQRAYDGFLYSARGGGLVFAAARWDSPQAEGPTGDSKAVTLR